MEIILFLVAGALIFLLGTVSIRQRLRVSATKESAESLSRVSHALFWLGLVLPGLVGIIYPGRIRFEGLLGLPSLLFHGVRQVVSGAALLAGAYFLVASSLALKKQGLGFAAFKLTRPIVTMNVYEQLRNPMSLGAYLVYLGVNLLSGSTYLLAGTLFVIIPVHLFNLRYFEGKELWIRYGEAYAEYRERVPFIIPWNAGRAYSER